MIIQKLYAWHSKSNQNLKFSYTNNNNLNIIFNLKSVGKIYADNANNTSQAIIPLVLKCQKT